MPTMRLASNVVRTMAPTPPWYTKKRLHKPGIEELFADSTAIRPTLRRFSVLSLRPFLPMKRPSEIVGFATLGQWADLDANGSGIHCQGLLSYPRNTPCVHVTNATSVESQSAGLRNRYHVED